MCSDKKTITKPEARAIARAARRAYVGGFDTLKSSMKEETKLKLGENPGELHGSIEGAALRALEEKFEIVGPDSFSYHENLLLFEYSRIQELCVHYSTMNVQITALAAAISFVIWTLILVVLRDTGSKAALIAIAFELGLFGALSIFIQMITVNRRIFALKCQRLREIEEDLGEADQHSRFSFVRRETRGELLSPMNPAGHMSEILLYYVLTCLGIGVTLILHLPVGPNAASYVQLLVAVLPFFLMIWWGARCKVLLTSVMPGYHSRNSLHKAWMKLGRRKRQH